MKHRSFLLLFALMFPWILPAQSGCDTTLFYEVLNQQIAWFEKHSKTKHYFIITKTNLDTQIRKNFPDDVCNSISTLDEQLIRAKGTLISHYPESGGTVYRFSSLKINEARDSIRLEVTSGDPGWCSSTVVYLYQKKKRSWKMVKKQLIGVT